MSISQENRSSTSEDGALQKRSNALTRRDYAILVYLLAQTFTAGAPLYGWISCAGWLQFKHLDINATWEAMLVTSQVASLPASFFADRFGAKVAGLSGMGMLALGCILLGVGFMQESNFLCVAGCVPIGLAAPMQIVSVQLALRTLFPQLVSNLNITLINGNYDASAIMFAFWGLFVYYVGDLNSRSHLYGVMMMIYAVLAVGHIGIVWYFASKYE